MESAVFSVLSAMFSIAKLQVSTHCFSSSTICMASVKWAVISSATWLMVWFVNSCSLAASVMEAMFSSLKRSSRRVTVMDASAISRREKISIIA